MKVGSSADYNVRVRPRGWDEPEQQRALYDGIYTFELNQVVGVSFVPDVSAAGPPWSADAVPDDLADFRTPADARITELVTAAYSVTPHPALAGSVERMAWPFDWDDDQVPAPQPTVFYVRPASTRGG